ncbi:MAG TPA: NFACT family protein [Thermotogota bacterium]|nr:NFACT family protein [Thermotogota bacterium]HRW92017.1 NFACT family protein [Thermotogota bacterium]
MQIDGYTLRLFVKEISEQFVGKRIRKISLPKRERFFLQFAGGTLAISLSADSFGVYRCSDVPSAEGFPPAFAMLLRKYLQGGLLEDCAQLGLDRICRFSIRSRMETGDERLFFLFAELMGHNSNLVFTDENRVILDAWHRKINELRSLVAGVPYVPFLQSGIDLSEAKELAHRFQSALSQGDGELPVQKWLRNTFQGLGKVHLEELVSRAAIPVDRTLGQLDSVHQQRLLQVLGEFSATLEHAKELYLVRREQRPIALSPLLLSHLQSPDVHMQKLAPSQALSHVFSARFAQGDLESLQKKLLAPLQKKIKKVERLHVRVENDLRETQDMGSVQRDAELLVGHLYLFDPSARRPSVEVPGWETRIPHRIELDPRKTISQNAQAMFQRVAKWKRRKEYATLHLQRLDQELAYLYQLRQSIEDMDSREDYAEIHAEMVSGGLWEKREDPRKKKKQKAKKATPVSQPRRFEHEGFTILVGRNNLQNDRLTRGANENDLWLHARQMPGSHVVVVHAGKSIPPSVVEFAASLAARFSKGAGNPSVPVDFTRVKNVHKPRGAHPGMVIYRDFQSLSVSPFRGPAPEAE